MKHVKSKKKIRIVNISIFICIRSYCQKRKLIFRNSGRTAPFVYNTAVCSSVWWPGRFDGLGIDESERIDLKRLFVGFMSVLMNMNMRIADHSGTVCSCLSGCAQIRGLKAGG